MNFPRVQEYEDAVAMYVEQFREAAEKDFQENVKEVERDLDLLVEDALPCCAICARIGAWRAIALGLRDLTYEDGVLEVNCSRHREQIEYIQKVILAPLYRSRNELLAEETAAYEAALVEQRYCEKDEPEA